MTMSEKVNERGAASERDDVAIIGMACVFPKAPDLATYWRNILAKVDAIGDPPEDSLTSRLYDPESTANDRIYCRRGGYLDELPPFNAGEYGVMPIAVDGAEPEHFMALEVAFQALKDAGFPEKPFNRERIEVILGRGTFVNRGYTTVMQHGLILDQTIHLLKGLHPEYSDNELAEIKNKLKSQLPPFGPETAPGLCHNLMAGIIANRLDLKGRTLVVDGACASCLLALEIGMDDLINGKCDTVLIGAVQISTHAPIHMIFSQLGALSRSSHLRPFDKDADGTMLGEGIGMMVLKRLKDAVRDGHRIYAVVKGVGSSSDGRGKGLLAPRLEGEELALRRAYEASGVEPSSIGLIEAHGTAIPLGDATELQALMNVFGANDNGLKRCALGSVKSMIGHLIPAAGVAGLIKGALALYHKVLPPTIFCDNPHPDLDRDKTPFYINTEARPWIHGTREHPRRAGVSSFGFGGINAHVVLEEFNQIETSTRNGIYAQWESELLVLDGDTRSELLRRCEEVQGRDSVSLVELAHHVNTDYQGRPYRLALVAESLEDLNRKLEHAVERLRDPNRSRIKEKSGIFFFEKPLGPGGKLAFLFPGEGSQYVSMLEDVCLHFPQARRCFDLLDRVYQDHPHPPSRFLFPATPKEKLEAEARIWEMDGAVDAVTTADRAIFQVLRLLGIHPDAVLGHSSGEFMALEAAGAVVLRDEEELMHYILAGNRMIEALKSRSETLEGRLLAVGGVDQESVARIMQQSDDFLVIAMDNCPHQMVLCGSEQSTDRAAVELGKMGGICQKLPFHRAYHTERFRPVLPALEEVFRRATLAPPSIPLYSCVTASPYPQEPEEIRRLAIEHWARPVRFRETIEAMYRDGIRVFLEVGPRANLSGFVRDILKGKPFLAMSSNVHLRSGITQLNHALGLLAAHGYSVDLKALYTHRVVEKEELKDGLRISRTLPLFNRETVATAELRPPKSKNEPTIETPQQGSLMRESKSFSPPRDCGLSEIHAPTPAGSASPVAHNGRDKAMGEYLKTMEQFLEAQEQVMLGYLAGQDSRRPDQQASYAMPSKQSGDTEEQVDRAVLSREAAGEPTPRIGGPEAFEGGKDLREILFGCVSDKTGYPTDILSENQNLEADLGIDSIKRVEILGAISKHLAGVIPTSDLEKLTRLQTLGEILRFLEKLRDSGGDDEPSIGAGEKDIQGEPLQKPWNAQELPLIGEVVRTVPRKEIAIRRRFTLQKDLFLQDHTLGGRVSRFDEKLLALPVMPFAMTLEIMAEAASLLFPELKIVGVKDVKAYGWILLKEEEVTLEVLVRTISEGQEAKAEVRIIDPIQRTKALSVEGIVLFGPAYSEAPPLEVFQFQEELRPGAAGEPFYPEALFHGPSFQCLSAMNRCGINGLEADLKMPPRDNLFQSVDHPRFLTSPLLLDGAGQTVGLWAIRTLETDFVIFPTGVSEIRFHKPFSAPLEEVKCCAHTALEGDDLIVSDVALIDRTDTLAVRLTGLQHRRIRMPEVLHLFRGSRDVLLTTSLQIPFEQSDKANTLVCRRFDPSGMDFDSADGRVMRDVIAHIVLSRSERNSWTRLEGPEQRRTDWLLARVAGKEAVRLLLRRVSGIDLWLADIDLQKDLNGQPMVAGEKVRRLGLAPAISLSHAGGSSIAIAGLGKNGLRVGIDMEPIVPKEKSFLQMAFSEQEIELLKQVSPLEEEWTLRFWCAKEAVAKSLGLSLPGGPRDLSIREIAPQSGVVILSLSERLSRELPALAGKPHKVLTIKTGSFVVASTIYCEGDELEE